MLYFPVARQQGQAQAGPGDQVIPKGTQAAQYPTRDKAFSGKSYTHVLQGDDPKVVFYFLKVLNNSYILIVHKTHVYLIKKNTRLKGVLPNTNNKKSLS